MNLKPFLNAMGWSQTDLANKVGTSSQNISKMCNGISYPSYEICKKLLELGMPLGDLFDIEDYQPIDTSEKISMNEFTRRMKIVMDEWLKEHPNAPQMTALKSEPSPDKYR